MLAVVPGLAVDEAHGRVQVAEVMIAQVHHAHVAEPGPEVQLDGLAVAGQRGWLEFGLRLPPAQAAGQVLTEGGPAVLDMATLPMRPSTLIRASLHSSLVR